MLKQSTLYYQGGGSDKFYAIGIKKYGTMYSVPFAYGRRLSTIHTGFKVNHTTWNKALETYEKVVKEKLAKGYWRAKGSQAKEPSLNPLNGSTTEYNEADEIVTPTVSPVSPKPVQPLAPIPQLLIPIDESDVQSYIDDPAYGAQEKYDGKHVTIRNDLGTLKAFNKKGLPCAIPTSVQQAVWNLSYKWGVNQFTIDGELVGERYYLYDIIELQDWGSNLPLYGKRHEFLQDKGKVQGIYLAYLACSRENKQSLYNHLKNKGREGIVFKRLDAPFSPGKSSNDFLKAKFYAEASCKVSTEKTGKRSIFLLMFDTNSDLWVKVGKCTIPANKDIPLPGSYVEIRYLYAYKGGALYQPTYKGERDDVDDSDCCMKQLKYKCEDQKGTVVGEEFTKEPLALKPILKRKINWRD